MYYAGIRMMTAASLSLPSSRSLRALAAFAVSAFLSNSVSARSVRPAFPLLANYRAS